jgi:glycosyltransferase involved in cell wall biosynthesis
VLKGGIAHRLLSRFGTCLAKMGDDWQWGDYMNSKKICFVAPNAYPLLQNNSTYQFMGGAELQQVLLGHCLKKKGYDVSFITLRWGDEKSDELLCGIKILKTYAGKEGFPYLRFFYPRLFKTWRALKRADADIYYQRGAESLTGIVSLFCVMRKKIFLFSSAHDRNFIPSIGLPRLFDKKIYSWGLKRASHVIVQSEYQRQMLLKNYGLPSTTLKNFYIGNDLTEDKKNILWVSNIKKVKRPLLLIRIAKLFPGYKFIMVGGGVKGEEELYKKVVDEAENIENIEFRGFMPLEETEKYFNGASLFINTAEMEGFPNTFLQAWSRGIPTISFLDIDGVIAKNNLGVVVDSIDEIKLHFVKLINLSIEERQKIRSYFVRAHSPDSYVEEFDSIVAKFYKENQPTSA